MNVPNWPDGLPYDRFQHVLNAEYHERAFEAATRLAERFEQVAAVLHHGGEVPPGDPQREQTDRWIVIAYLASDQWTFAAFPDTRARMQRLVDLFAPQYRQPLVVMS